MLEWGLIPAWTGNDIKANQIRNFTLNARSESIFEKPPFKNSIFSQRYLIPATGFFEIQHSGKNILPYYIFIPEPQFFLLREFGIHILTTTIKQFIPIQLLRKKQINLCLKFIIQNTECP